MLFISIPNGETSGRCRINGEPHEFEIDTTEDTFSFRPADSPTEPWDTRFISAITEGPSLTQYICGGEGEPRPAAKVIHQTPEGDIAVLVGDPAR